MCEFVFWDSTLTFAAGDSLNLSPEKVENLTSGCPFASQLHPLFEQISAQEPNQIFRIASFMRQDELKKKKEEAEKVQEELKRRKPSPQTFPT